MEQASEILDVLSGVVTNPSLNGAIGLFVFSFVAEVVAPIPSSIVFAGQILFFQEAVSMSLFLKMILFVSVPMALGTTIGSYLTYGLAYWGGKPAIEKFKKYLRFSWEDVERWEGKLKSSWYDEFVFLGIRSIPLIPTIPLNILAGILRMNIYRYTILSILGITIKMTIMLALMVGGVAGIIGLINL